MFLTQHEIAILIGKDYMGSVFEQISRIEYLNAFHGFRIQYSRRLDVFGSVFAIDVDDRSRGPR